MATLEKIMPSFLKSSFITNICFEKKHIKLVNLILSVGHVVDETETDDYKITTNTGKNELFTTLF